MYVITLVRCDARGEAERSTTFQGARRSLRVRLVVPTEEPVHSASHLPPGRVEVGLTGVLVVVGGAGDRTQPVEERSWMS